MQLVIVNTTGSTKTYLSGAISVPASGSTAVTNTVQQLSLSTDGALHLDVVNSLVNITDGTNIYSNNEALDYLRRIDALLVPLSDTVGNGLTSTLVSGKQALDVNMANVASITSSVVDKTSFIYGTNSEQPIGAVYQDSSAILTAGTTGALRSTAYRALHVSLRDNAGNEKIGQTNMAGSIPVTIASDQTTLPVSITTIASGYPQTFDMGNLLPIGFGDSITTPIWPCMKPLGVYVVPAGKTFRLFGVICKSSGASSYLHIYTRTTLWRYAATALATPGAPTLAAKTYTGSGLTTLSTYRYKITATNIMGETVASTEASITLSGAQNAVSLSWSGVTNALDYRIYRTSANGATGTEKRLQITEGTTFTDVSPDSELNASFTPPVSNTTSGSSTALSYATNYASTDVVIDTLAPIASPTALDVIYKNIYGFTNYLTVTPSATVGTSVQLKVRGWQNPSDGRRIKDHDDDDSKCRSGEVGVNDIVGLGNLPSTGSFAIYGINHLFHISSDQSNRWVTQYFDETFTFQAGTQVFFGASSNTGSTTAGRHDVLLLGQLE